MNGNRGAKGSIKDRLISMLYRMRYKKKVLKEEEYTIKNKEKQVEYLKNLKNFEEKENINLLDKTDIQLLDSVKYNVNFKIVNKDILDKNFVLDNKNKELDYNEDIYNYSFKVSNKGISDNVILELDSIERKNSDLEEKVDIKKEIKKTKNEVVILKEVDDFIKESLSNINDIKNEIESIKIEAKDKNKQTDKIEERYKKLKSKVEKLKIQYDIIKEKYDLSEFKIIESVKLIDNINDYKSVAKLNEMEMLLNICKQEINKISGITIINTETKKVGKNIENTKKDHIKIKIKFKKDKEKIEKLNDVENNLKNELKYQQELINDMFIKASYFEKQINKQVYYVDNRNMLASFLRIAGGILTLPLSGKNLFGIALGNNMINKGLKEMNKSLEKKERIVINYKYEDISKQIENVSNKIEYINLVLSDSLIEIQKLKNNFNTIFNNYDNILPEYKDTLEKIELLEKSLLTHQEKINNMNKNLNQEKEMNKIKMKQIKK